MMPCPRCLFKTIEELIKPTQMVRMLRILKSRWLAQEQMNGSWFDNRTESIFIIQPIPLLKPLGDQSCFIALNRPVRVVFNFEHPLGINNMDTSNRRNKMP